jgi:hypothetical protein
VEKKENFKRPQKSRDVDGLDIFGPLTLKIG